jgi:hypothetical protein
MTQALGIIEAEMEGSRKSDEIYSIHQKFIKSE